MEELRLTLIIAQYQKMLNDIEESLNECNTISESEPYQQMYSLGNDIAQQIEEFKWELKQLKERSAYGN